MYEDYLEDYVYKLMAKVGSRICRLFKTRRDDGEKVCNTVSSYSQVATKNLLPAITDDDSKSSNNKNDTNKPPGKPNTDVLGCPSNIDKNESVETKHEQRKGSETDSQTSKIDEDLNSLNFHMMMFFLWLIVAIVNIPALLTWARNFKYSMVLKPDTSYHTGLVMSICSAFVWQLEGPRRNLRYYEALSSLIFTMALFVLVLGVFSLAIVNYGVTLIFAIITIQQLWDFEENVKECNVEPSHNEDSDVQNSQVINENQCDKENLNKSKPSEGPSDNKNKEQEEKCTEDINKDETPEDCDVCSENRIYKVFKNLREKFSFNTDV